MSIRGRNGHVWVTLREMRIGRIDRKIRVKPCTEEYSNYMKAMQAAGEDGTPPVEPGQLLMDCMDGLENMQKPASIKGHLKRFLRQGE